ncbi:helix-turn-helix domain-containing protein [Rhizobium sp. Root482]|jgi:transcriptional regulator with XRE-family HTH domain|uniref:helix-turn-helix domain-containing protein n=1 Tax=Rhizobium sp. Root482 TaxID=1736543 RepID=UPI0006FD834D|nr:cupin domain-containing protein [Rhizobium sp. Root482]KQY12321.1 XRE family transcriptional regulator [Rhizobium sp. Root482]
MTKAIHGDDKRRIGERLRLRRKLRGMALKHVAEKSGLSVGMLSQVERGLITPSIKSMRSICDALEMPVIWLFEGPAEQSDDDIEFVVRRPFRRDISYENGAILKEILTPDTQPKIQMLRFVLEPGADSGEPYSNAEGGKCGLVLRGTLELELNGRRLNIREGDSFAFPAQALVRFWNEGQQPCEVIWVVAPATV